MNEIHQIRLRGRWQVSFRDSNSNSDELQQRELQIRRPEDWAGWMGDHDPKGIESVVLKRSFNWTFPQPPPGKVELIVTEVLSNAKIFVNDDNVGRITTNSESQTCRIESLLQPRNELRIELDGWPLDVQLAPLGEVYLAIS